jgi:hypothetical protein
MIGPRVTHPAAELDAAHRVCTCCGRELTGTVAWLELDTNAGQYTDGGMAVASQGWFPFGMSCARKRFSRD